MLRCVEAEVRTTLTIADDVLDEYRRVAAATHRTLSAVVEEGLRELAARRSTAVSRPSSDFTIVGGEGLRPGVTLDDNAALRELLDEDLPLKKRR
jgi:hypothetical protein